MSAKWGRRRSSRGENENGPETESPTRFIGLPPGQHAASEFAWYDLETCGHHRVFRAALGERSDRIRVAEHLRERRLRNYDRQVAFHGDLPHDTTATVEVADDIALVIGRRAALYRHDRLEQYGT